MDEHHIGITAACHVQRLTGAQGDHLDVDAAGFLERWQQVCKQAGLLGRGGGRDHDRGALRPGHRAGQQGAYQQMPQGLEAGGHVSSP